MPRRQVYDDSIARYGKSTSAYGPHAMSQCRETGLVPNLVVIRSCFGALRSIRQGQT